jgi:branched-chain amino acid transport system substrate-binding protein
MRITRRAALLSAAGLAVHAKARAAEPVRIGQVAPSTGSGAEFGRFEMSGARLALSEINAAGGVLGRPIEIITEDDQTTNPGAVLAFSRLAGRDDIAAFLGPAPSTQNHAIAPDVIRAARPLMFGGTDPTLTHAGNKWVFRCRPNDSYSARVIAQFGVNDLAKRSWAIVHSTDAFGTSGMQLLSDALDKLGLKPSLVQGYANQQPDFTAVVLAIKQSGADIIGSYFTFPNDLAVFARQLRQLGVSLPWIGSPSIVTTTSLNLAGPALFGTYGVADFNPDASPEAHAFAELYEKTYKSRADLFGAWTYDALRILARAMTAAGGTDPEAVRQAILAIQGFKGAEGTYNFDANGDGLHAYNVVKNDGGNIVFVRHTDFDI